MKTETKEGEPARGRGGLCPPLGPPVGRFPRFVSVFVFVLIFDFSNFDFLKYFCEAPLRTKSKFANGLWGF